MVELNSEEIKLRMSKAIDSFKKDLSGLRVGRASSSMLDQSMLMLMVVLCH